MCRGDTTIGSGIGSFAITEISSYSDETCDPSGSGSWISKLTRGAINSHRDGDRRMINAMSSRRDHTRDSVVELGDVIVSLRCAISFAVEINAFRKEVSGGGSSRRKRIRGAGNRGSGFGSPRRGHRRRARSRTHR